MNCNRAHKQASPRVNLAGGGDRLGVLLGKSLASGERQKSDESREPGSRKCGGRPGLL